MIGGNTSNDLRRKAGRHEDTREISAPNTECFTDGFGLAKFAAGGSILGSSQFSQLPQLPLKTTLDLKKVKIGLKIIILLH